MLSISGNFKKKQNKPQQSTSYWVSLSSKFTNLQYQIKKYTTQFKDKLFSGNQQQQECYVIIQGKKVKNRTQAKKAVKEILWFSYRKGFNIKNQYTSDVGWGCLIRVGQMALASALVKYFKNQRYMNVVDVQNQVFAITAAFSDVQGRQQKYSLNKVIGIAQKQFQQKPGQWFNLFKIGYCLRTMQNKYPMKGSQNLQLVLFDQCINIRTILDVQCLKQCACAKKKIVCQKCHSNFRPAHGQKSTIKSMNQSFHTVNSSASTTFGMKKDHFCQQQKLHKIKVSLSQQNQNIYHYRHLRLKRDMMVILLTRASNNENTDKAIFTLLDLNICLGIMTGFPKKAIFVVGREEKGKLIYLDPHYVQQNSKFQELKSQTYFCQEYLLTQWSALDPSMAFCFYIQTLYQLEILSDAIQKVNRHYKQCLSLAVDNTKYSFNPHDYQEVQEDSMSMMSFSL